MFILKGMFENVCLAIKVALDLNIDKKSFKKDFAFSMLLKVDFNT